MKRFATWLNKHGYLCELEKKLPDLTLETKTDFILYDWMEDNILYVSAERRLAQYVQLTWPQAGHKTVNSKFGGDRNPARDHPTSRELVANKEEHLAAEDQQNTTANEQNKSPTRTNSNDPTSLEMLQVAQQAADKVGHLAAVLSEDQQLRNINEQDLVMKTYHFLREWKDNQPEGACIRHRLASALAVIGKQRTADMYVQSYIR